MDELIIGQEYYFDKDEQDSGIFLKREGPIFWFEHVSGSEYLKDTDTGLIGFFSAPEYFTPVTPTK